MPKQLGRRIFGSIDVDQKSAELLCNLDAYVSVYVDELVNKFVECFKQYAEKIIQMQQLGKKEAIAFINFSILRTNILTKKHALRIDAYDQNWYRDRKECIGEYDISDFFKWHGKFESLLEAARKNSGGRLTLADVQALVFKESYSYLRYVTEIIRIGMKKVAKTESFQNIKRYEQFIVCVGNYQDKTQIVYRFEEALIAEEIDIDQAILIDTGNPAQLESR